MTIQNTYRKAVQKLPINQRKKNFLLRYWKGGLLGLIIYPLLIWGTLRLQMSTLMNILGWPLKYPMIWITQLICPSGDWGCVYVAFFIMLILAAIVGLFIGIIIEKIIKRGR